MITSESIHEIRGIVRLEALRAAVFSVASESLDSQTSQFAILVKLDGDVLEASFEYRDASGHAISGGTL